MVLCTSCGSFVSAGVILCKKCTKRRAFDRIAANKKSNTRKTRNSSKCITQEGVCLTGTHNCQPKQAPVAALPDDLPELLQKDVCESSDDEDVNRTRFPTRGNRVTDQTGRGNKRRGRQKQVSSQKTANKKRMTVKNVTRQQMKKRNSAEQIADDVMNFAFDLPPLESNRLDVESDNESLASVTENFDDGDRTDALDNGDEYRAFTKRRQVLVEDVYFTDSEIDDDDIDNNAMERNRHGMTLRPQTTAQSGQHVLNMHSTRSQSRVQQNEDLESDYENDKVIDLESSEGSWFDEGDNISGEDGDDSLGVPYIITGYVRPSACCNCGREPCEQGLTEDGYTFRLSSVDVRRWQGRTKKFCNIDFKAYTDRRTTVASLCTQCLRYMNGVTSMFTAEELSACVWPSFVWSVLKNPVTCIDAWKLVPQRWRVWWETTMKMTFFFPEETVLETVPCLFDEVTKATELDLDALSNLRWAKDIMPREVSLALPTVKCPVGCSEWKHRSNGIPIDIVWEKILGRNIKLFSNTSCRSCTELFRDDFLIPDRILHNPSPDWLCRASIAQCGNMKVPMVLSCRHHDQNSKGMMVHPCRSPSKLPTPKANQFCAAMVTPRTIEKSRARKYSASFQMATMHGSYAGLDTMYLTTDGGFHYYQSNLAWQQEVLAYKGRVDTKAYIHKLVREGKIGANVAERMEHDGDILFPDWATQKSDMQQGGSFMRMDDAVKLYQGIRYEGTETVILSPDDNGQRKTISFTPSWPLLVSWIHPSGSKHGRKIPEPMIFNNTGMDTRGMWMLCGLLTTVPCLWNIVAKTQKRTESWEGFFLTIITERCLPHSGFQTSSNPFKIKKKEIETLLKDVFRPLSETKYSAIDIGNKFLGTHDDPEKYDRVSVQMNEFTMPSSEIEVVVLLNDSKDTDDPPTIPDMLSGNNNSKSWELRYVALTEDACGDNANAWKGTAYCRHGGILHPCWWRANRSKKNVEAMDHEWTIEHLSDRDKRNWDVCVLVKRTDGNAIGARDQILSACGGQTKVYCKEHNFPLISVPDRRKKGLQCSCCDGELPLLIEEEELSETLHQPRCTSKARYTCPTQGCTNSICGEHHLQVIEGPQKFLVSAEHQNCCYGLHPMASVASTSNNPSAEGTGEGNLSEFETHIPMFNARTEADDPLQGLRIAVDINNDVDDDWLEVDFRRKECELEDVAEGNDGCPDDLTFHMRDSAMEEFFVTGQNTVDDDPGRAELDDETGEAFVPTTNAGTLPVWSLVKNEPYASNRTSNHVLLNNYGSCLVRRNSRMDGTQKSKNFLQGIAATTPGDCIPLVYPEGMLFSDQFFLSEEDGSLAGALPAALLHDDQVLKRQGIRSLQDHYRSRLSNHGLLASANPKYHFFAFDSLVNLGLRGCDSRIVLRRGFAEHQGKGGVTFKGNKDPIFDTEQVDCRPVVNMLSAAIGEEQPTYFYTHTCSMKTHFGIKLIWDWITGEKIIPQVCSFEESDWEEQHIRRCILDGAGILLLRCWMEMMHIWILYITKSPEQPLGPVTKFFFRMELQDATANLPHMHSILWTDDDLTSESGIAIALDRIRGFVDDIVRPDEREQLIQEGIYENETAIVRFLEMMSTVLPHEHLRRCYVRVRDEKSDSAGDVLRCKVPNNFKLNPHPSSHSFIPIHVEHSQEAIHVMQSIGLCKPPPDDHEDGAKLIFEPLVDSLKAVKHVPPANGNEGIISAVPGFLCSRNPNACNIQFTTGYLLSRYLAKYIASIDLYNVIRITPPRPDSDNNIYYVEGRMQLNSKITGNRIGQRKEESKTRNVTDKQARAINIVETYMLMFGYDPVIKNIDFVNVPTQPYEERAAKSRARPLFKILRAPANKAFKEKFDQNYALSAIDTVPCHHVREQTMLDDNGIVIPTFPIWRRFTPNQIKKAEDDLQSPLATDGVTTFSLRPPELRFVMHQDKYARWFTQETNNELDLVKQIDFCRQRLDADDLRYSFWIDATSSLVHLRALAVDEIIEYIDTAPHWYFGSSMAVQRQYKNRIKALFLLVKEAIVWYCTGELANPGKMDLLRDIMYRLVRGTDATMLPVVWYRSVRPTQPTRFLIHLLLSYGAFVDEYSLFNQPTLRDSFIKAGLLDPNNTYESARELSKKYLLTQLITLPAGTVTFDRYVVASFNTIKAFFENGDIFSDEMPSVLYCRLTTATDEKIKAYSKQKRTDLVKNLLDKLQPVCGHCLPQESTCTAATLSDPDMWVPLGIPRPNEQPEQSYIEQQKLLCIGKNTIDNYVHSISSVTKSLCVVGAGGVGKTTANQMILLYALCRGLNATATALASERSQELAGEHINSFLCMPRNASMTPGQISERCISNLYRNPEKLQYLRALDVLLLDEAGNVPAEIISVLDIVLRYVKDSNKPFGGIVILATMDNLQIEPPTGRHPLLSSLFISSFIFYRLQECVRAAEDANWRRVQEITRLPPQCLNETIRNEFVRLLVRECSWVPDDESQLIPPNALFVYGKNAPIRQQEQKLFRKLRASSTPFIISTSEDHERTIEGKLVRASQATSEALDKKVKEPQHLYLFHRGRYQVTANERGQYSNSQLAMLFKMPTTEQVQQKEPIEMLLSPPGSRYIPADTDDEDRLKTLGWKTVMVHKCSEHVTNVRSGIRGTRSQYRLRHHVGSTEHSVMGQTLAMLVTRVGRGKSNPYNLWLPSQVVVLTSRTKRAIHTTFVSKNPAETANILFDTLRKDTPFRTYIGYLLDQLCSGTSPSQQATTIDFNRSIVRPRDVPLPNDDTGCCYLLMSLRDTNFTYIGSTDNMHKRLRQHNSGFGSVQTAPCTLRPWALLAYVVGFDGNKSKRIAFENRWISLRRRLQANRSIRTTIEGIVDLAKETIEEFNVMQSNTFDLRMVNCGTLSYIKEQFEV